MNEIKELLDERDKLMDSFFTHLRDSKFIDVEANLKQQKVIEAKLMILLDSVDTKDFDIETKSKLERIKWNLKSTKLV